MLVYVQCSRFPVRGLGVEVSGTLNTNLRSYNLDGSFTNIHTNKYKTSMVLVIKYKNLKNKIYFPNIN